jgi:hypothetical protein
VKGFLVFNLIALICVRKSTVCLATFLSNTITTNV